MKVKCINNKMYWGRMVCGNVYTVLGETETSYLLRDEEFEKRHFF